MTLNTPNPSIKDSPFWDVLGLGLIRSEQGLNVNTQGMAADVGTLNPS